MCARIVALCCAALVALGAVTAYTVDCNHEYTDCDSELTKYAAAEDSMPIKSTVADEAITTTSKSLSTTITATPKFKEMIEDPKSKPTTESPEMLEAIEEVKPKPRLLNLNVDELQNFANALHNQTDKGSKKLTDLSDVNLDDDEEEPAKINDHHEHNDSKEVTDKFYSNLQAPFHSLISGTTEEEEAETCKENEMVYKIGEKIERGCEEICECIPAGLFECSPRCKHPYIRRGRRLNDPLCFESPVDECCSIIACATGNGDQKMSKEVCKYGNDTHAVGSKWYIGCETTCSCEPNSVVTCKPRCKRLPPSDKCINVQDPNDACCEVQVCDVSQDVHELPENVTTTTTTTIQPRLAFEDFEETRSSNRPLVLTEPIGSIKVLHNNSVQVNLMHMNDSEDPIHLLLSDDGGRNFQDVELKYANLILNLEGGKDYILKTKETGTKFNFTITSSDGGLNEVEDRGNGSKAGCWEEGKFYEVGEEFRIGCTELCECTGPDDTRECAALVCPNHVGLEIMSKGCVKWAPSPPAQPPNCCPRSARCLSDGTCHYNGVPVPNWTEVPIALTGCEQRCFCENGDLDCQEVCSHLPPVPPQTLRCPPMHRPAPVNISDEDCCKQWGCVPNGTSGSEIYSMQAFNEPINYVTPISPILSTATTQVLPPPLATYPVDFYKHINPFKSFPKFQKPITPAPFKTYVRNGVVKSPVQIYHPGDNITVFTLQDIGSPFKTIQAAPPLVHGNNNYWPEPPKVKTPKVDLYSKPHMSISHKSHSHPEMHVNFVVADNKVQNIMHQPRIPPVTPPQSNSWDEHKPLLMAPYETVRKNPMLSSKAFNYFSPTHETQLPTAAYRDMYPKINHDSLVKTPKKTYFEPADSNRSKIEGGYFSNSNKNPSNSLMNDSTDRTLQNLRTKAGLIHKTKDLRHSISHQAYKDFWHKDTETHVLTKQPNPYETVLLRAIPSPKAETKHTSSQRLHSLQVPTKSYSPIDLEHLLNQMEIQSEVNRNLGRSADKNQGPAAGQPPQMPPGFPPHKPQSPPFLPTIPPDLQFPQDEELPDYDQNNIHRPPESGLAVLPPGVPPTFEDINKKLSVISIEADSPTSIKMLLGLPPVFVGLRGSIDLRYTDKADEDVSHWYSQVFAPADEVLTTPRLEFRLTGLNPSTIYKVRGRLYLHNLPISPESKTYSVRTQDLPQVAPVEEKRREIDSGLTVVEVNDTTAQVSWRHFTEDELQFIDGIQVRYRPVGTPIYSMTELLHHSRSAAELQELRPGSRYEASLVLIPPPRSTTELHDPGNVEFTTKPYNDPYNWTVVIEVRSVGAEAAELTWRGVPSPAERWVRVYRAAHACGDQQAAGKEHDEFKLAARDQPPSVTLSGLKPETRCRVWLELFLTNGKVKTSNVLEINTKSLDTDNPIDNEIEASSQSGSRSGRPRGDYYTALVGVGVVAALGALTSLLLLLVVVRRHRPRSVPITPVPTAPRESSLPPYDNPAYKLELQQETMDL